jgi:small subunit ribosomal protein S4
MRKIRKAFKRPLRPWDATRIKDQRALMNQYGLTRNIEVLRAESMVRDFRQRTRKLIATKKDADVKTLLAKLEKLGVIKHGQGLDDVLALNTTSILERRLQTIVFRKGLARTPRQARQCIVHNHVEIAGRKINIPSYIVPVNEEEKIKLADGVVKEKPAPAKDTTVHADVSPKAGEQAESGE